MASSKSRQRKLARAKLDRQQARRYARARRNRQLQAGLAVLLVVVIGVVIGLFTTGVFSGGDNKPKTASATCEWNVPANTQSLTDVGKPPTTGEPRSGTETMTVTTNQGTVAIDLDLSKAPCAASSFSYLAGKNFFNNTKCHRLTTSGLFVLQCGDPKGDGTGGPAYTFADEYLPPAAAPSASADPSAGTDPSASPSADASGGQVLYPRGTVAMANSGADTNGSQFFIVYKDTQFAPSYTEIGTVASGLDVVDKIAAGGAVDANGATTGDGSPKIQTTIQTLTVSKPGATPAPSTSTSPSASASVAPSGAS